MIRILVASLNIQQFRWLLNSSKIRWPQNSCKVHLGFWSEFCWFMKMTNLLIRKLDDHGTLMKFLKGFWSEFLSRIRWPQNSCEIFQGFRSEFWWPAFVSNSSDDYEVLQELDDHGILVKFFQDFNQNYFQELNDHRILKKFFKDFDHNSACQP